MLLNVGRLAREKNLALLLEAFAAAEPINAHLVLVGDGPSRGWLENRAATLGIGERVIFAGAVERDAIAAWYSAADLFVFTSLSETQGLVVDEALQLGVPTLAVGAGGVIDVLARWPGGRMVEPGDDLAARYADALRDLLGRQELLTTLRQQARANVGHDDGHSTAALIKIYEAAIAAGPKPRRRRAPGPPRGKTKVSAAPPSPRAGGPSGRR